MLGCADFFGYAKPRLALILGERNLLLITAASVAGALVLVQVFMKNCKACVSDVSKQEWALSLSELLLLIVAVLALVLILFQRAVIPLLLAAVLSSAGLVIISRRSGQFLICRRSFCFKEAIQIGLIFLILDFLLSANNILQGKLITEFTRLGAHISALKLIDLAGLIIGFAVSILSFRKNTHNINSLACIALISILVGIVLMLTSTITNPTVSGLATFSSSLFMGTGQMILFCVFNTFLMDKLSIPLYFQSICLLGILRNCIGMPLGGSIICGVLSLLEPGESILPAIRGIYAASALLTISYLTFCTVNRNTAFSAQ